ncbi:Hypothetical protein POVN_LOCUS605 [uncultured virus]|nr:Hypothetical protein POVN_LOCUS605 [uncultured virus]
MVNTFLVASDFSVSAAWLDNTRLWKQVLEAYQILAVLTGSSDGWRNHPAVKMWEGYAPALKAYINAHIDEWARRGKNNNTKPKLEVNEKVVYPWWMQTEAIYHSHRANLLRKDPTYYAALLPHTDEAYLGKGYFWPAKVLATLRLTQTLTTVQNAVDAVAQVPLATLLAPVQNKPVCAGYYKNGKKCVATASRQLAGHHFCMRHS